MGIDHLFGDTPPEGAPAPRLTPRAPLSLKELAAILALIGVLWAAYDRLNKFAEKTAVERIVDIQTQMRLDAQHNFDALSAKVDRFDAKVDDLVRAQQQANEKRPRK